MNLRKRKSRRGYPRAKINANPMKSNPTFILAAQVKKRKFGSKPNKVTTHSFVQCWTIVDVVS
ncbi:hypothetical protein NECAME_03638 [Necator americanus]|uniref:Uncharacterized protein n=1 Tax=Necator americanus TaxID=51031 RepID=W2T1J4_NECAM|nr:hypothetical protein NECAME_03638 [Necator americanus]ETN75865.1 hypothetical protein NECAME_03638 [Necator americanus]